MPTQTQPDADLHLFYDVDRLGDRPEYLRAGFGSVLINILAFSLIAWLWSKDGTPPPENPLTAELRQATHLVAPRVHISQPSTVHSGVTKKVNLQDLLNEARQSPPPAPKRFVAPPVQRSPKPGPAPVAPPPPPKIEAAIHTPTPPPGVNTPVPPPRIQAEEPKLTFETPGAANANPRTNTGTLARILPPVSHSVDDAMHSVARSADKGGTYVSEMEVQIAPPQIPGIGSTPTRLKSAIAPQILSDTHGIDFRPYLIRVLTAVRRNWAAVVPESARLGRQGVVTLQFAIARDGSVPRLVISIPSGTDALDRAAVAGVSASNPFPPLPSEYPGPDLRLQLVFTYNMPRQ